MAFHYHENIHFVHCEAILFDLVALYNPFAGCLIGAMELVLGAPNS